MPYSGKARSAMFSRKQPGGVFVIDGANKHPGNVWFVDSGQTTTGADAAGFGQSPDAPTLTLDYAVGLCTANNGDVIYVMPGHTEAIIADSGVDIDQAGITVIGLGKGADRPTFTMGTAVTADFKLAAASIHVENILFLGGLDALTGPVEITGADCSLVNCEFRDVTGQATDAVMIVDGADRCRIIGHRHIGAAGAGADSAIAVDGADDLIVADFQIYGNFAVGGIDYRTHASARSEIFNGYIWTANAADICIVDTVTGSTGKIGPDLEFMLKDNAANITTAVTGATFHYFPPIYVCNLAGELAMGDNKTASTDG